MLDDIGSHFMPSASEDGEVVYFDTAGRSILPKAVYEVGQRALAQKLTPWLGVGSEEDPAAVRSLFATLIGAESAGDIAIVPSTAFAMSLAARNIARTGVLRGGSTVLVMENEMGSVVYPWQEACRAVGASFKVVLDPQPPVSWSDAVIAALVDDRSIAVVALPHVHWCDGSTVDLVAISKHLEAMSEDDRPLLVVDGTQSIGALPFNLKDFPVKPAFIACSVHKWLNGPYGMSLVYVSPAHQVEWGPLDQHERSRQGSDRSDWDEVGAMDRVSGCYPEQFFPGARRFDAGGKPNPVIVPMVREALELTLKWSPHAIQSYLMSLTDSIAAQLETLLGSSPQVVVTIKPKPLRSGHILGLRLLDPSVLSQEVHKLLKQHRMHVSVRSGWLRVSPYIYNTPAEANAFVSILVGVTRSILHLHPRIPAAVPMERPPYKLLLTGSTGWLGQFIYRHFLSYGRGGITVYAAYSCKNIPFWVPEECRVQLDLTSDSYSAVAAIESIRPDMIVHTAAITSPNVCHDDPSRAYQVNSCRALIDAVRTTVPDCLFIFTSTDMVYDGFQPPYLGSSSSLSSSAAAATAACSPINVYGATKLACESLVTQLRRGVVLRLSNMIGPSFVYKAFGGDKFLQWLLKAFHRRSFIGLKDREVRSFVWVHDVVALIHTIAELFMQAPSAVAVSADETPVLGTRDGLDDESALDAVLRSSGKVYNVGGPLSLSRLSLAARMCFLLGVDLDVVSASDACSESHHLHSSTWKVYIMNSPLRPSDVTAVATADGVPSFTQLHSPLDITMDSSSTEKAFSIRFTDLNEVLLQCCCYCH